MAEAADVSFLARYPFLPEAREWIRDENYQLGDLLADPAYEGARRRGVARVKGALARDGIPEASAANEVDAAKELVSYPLARALVATIEDAYLRNRYAVAESKLFHDRLMAEGDDVVWRLAEALGLPLREDPASFARVPFVEYLRHAPGRDPSWKLVNQALAQGLVSLTRGKVVRLAEEALKERLLDELEELQRPGRTLLVAFERDLNEIRILVASHRERFAPAASGPVRPEAFPPCMKAIWAGIAGHVNIPHMGRFAIVSFLHTLGMSGEEVLRYFATLPDFDVNKSRYQIDHITGQIGATEYTPPSCSTMQTYGICPLEQRDDLCLYRIHHPLSYYRLKVRTLPPPKPASPPPSPSAPEVKDGQGPGTAARQ